MNEINYFKVFIICSDDVTADVDHLHVKRTHVVDFSYIVRMPSKSLQISPFPPNSALQMS
jgi:hypothetical protein